MKKIRVLLLAAMILLALFALMACNEECTHANLAITSASNGQHTLACDACDYETTEKCSGGKATCQKGAICDKCGAEYTEADANAHTLVNGACTVEGCGMTCAHTWVNGACTVEGCGMTCDHTGKLSTTTVGNGQHKTACSVCDYTLTENCTGGTATCQKGKLCEKCGAEYTEKDPSAHSWNPQTGGCTVDGCILICPHDAQNLTVTSNGNGQHHIKCAICQYEEDRNCTGGTATCQNAAICENCHTAYGSPDANAHDWNATTGECDVTGCDAVCSHNYVVSDNQIDDNLHTKTCGICQHVTTEGCFGGEANTVERAICEGCGAAHGELYRYKHVVVIGVDGAGAFFKDTATPNLDRIFANGAVSYTAITANPAISAESWASLMHGVTPEVHHVTNESVKQPFATDSPYPSFFRVISENLPDAKLAAFCDWNYVNTGIIEEGLPNMTKNGGGDGSTQVGFVKEYLKTNIPTAMFVHIDDADLAGHGHGFGSPGQLLTITTIDGYIGQIYDAYVEKGLIDDTLFIVTADHGGVDMAHGMWAESCRNIIYAVAGKTVKQGGAIQDVEIRDTASIVLHALGMSDKQPETWTSRVPGDLFKGVDATDRPVYIDKTTDRYHETEPTPEAGSDKHVSNFVDNDLAVYLPFDGNVTDQCGNTTTPNGNLQYTDGYFGNAIQLGDGYVTLSDYALKNESFTISMWFQTKGSDAVPCIISNADWGGNKKGFTLAMYDNRDFRINIGTGSENFYCDMALPCGYAPYLPFGASPDFKEGWTHLSLSVDHEKNEIRFCFDFKWVFVLPYENLDSLDLQGVLNGLNIGQDGTGAYEDTLDIMMDELMIFNGAFDAEDNANLAKYYGKDLGGSGSTGTITLDGVQNTDITDDASAVAAGAVVRLNGNAYYTTLQAAINAANTTSGGTVTLLANVTIDSTVTVNQLLVIDGNDQYTVSYTGEGTLFALSGNSAAVAFEGIDLSANDISGVEASIYAYDHTLYATFIGAVTATKCDAYHSNEITLLADVTVSDPLTVESTVTVIGNGHTLTANAVITLIKAGSLELNGVSLPADKLVGAVALIENDGVVAYYATLQTAFAASGGYKVGVIKLLCDITLPANTTLEITRATANITIDGKKPDGSGNYKITATAGADDYKIFSSTHASTVITLQNLDITLNSTPARTAIFDGRATLNVLNCNLRSDKRGFNLIEGKLTVSNTFVYAVDEFAISLFRSNADLEIKDNSKIFSVKSTAVNADCNNGKITVANSVLAGANETIYIIGHHKTCDIVLNDGTILDSTWPSRNGYPEIVPDRDCRAILIMNSTGTFNIILSGNVYVVSGSPSPEIYAHNGTPTWDVFFGTDATPFEGTQIIRKHGKTYYFYDDVATAYDAMVAGDTVFTYSETTATEIEARGYIVEKNGHIYTVVGKTATEYVAQIGDQKYGTLEEAFAAATNGCTIKLLADITLPAQKTFTISEAITITLDGKKAAGSGNYTITATANAANYNVFKFQNAAASFTLQNVDIVVNSTYSGAAVADGKVNLTVKNCNLASDKCGFQITDGKLTISNTVLYAKDEFAIQTGDGTNVDIEIKDNSKILSVKQNAINFKLAGTLTVTDSVLSAGNETIYINSSANCDITLNDGAILDNTWAAKNGYPEIVANSSSRAICIHNSTGTYTITLNGNAYINNVYTPGADIAEILIVGGTPTVNVDFGTSFTGTQIIRQSGSTYYFYDDVVKAYNDAVTGDTVFTYSEATANKIQAQNYIVEKNDQVYIVVSRIITYVAQIGDNKYETLEEALAAATDGCTVTLLQDVTVSEQLTITQPIIINGAKADGTGNYKITVDTATASFRLFTVEANFTLQNVDVDFKNSANNGSIIYSTGKVVKITVNDSYLDSTNMVIHLQNNSTTTPDLTISGSTLIANAVAIYFDGSTANVKIQNQSKILGRATNASPAASVIYLYGANAKPTIEVTDSVISGQKILIQIRSSATPTIKLGKGAILDKSWAGLADYEIEPVEGDMAIHFHGDYGTIILDSNAYVKGYGTKAATNLASRFTFASTYVGTQIIRKNGNYYYFYDAVKATIDALAAGDTFFTYNKNHSAQFLALGYTAELVASSNVITYYKTLSEAIAAANVGNGGTVTLLADATLDATLSISKSIVIDGQGTCGITAAEGVIAFTMAEGGQLALNNVTVSGTVLAGYVAGNVTTNNAPLAEQITAEGYAVSNDGEIYTVVGVKSDYIAQVGENKYTTLTDAIQAAAAAKDKTVVLLQNITLESAIDQAITINLNANTLTVAATAALGAEITVTNGTLVANETKYVLVEDASAVLSSTGVAVNADVKIGSDYYATLKAAIDAANALENGATITLLDNVTVTEQLTITKPIVINGKNGDSNCKITVDTETALFRLFTVEANFTLQNVDVDFKNTASNGSVIYTEGKAVEITVNNSYLDSTNMVFHLQGHTTETKPTVTISGSTLISSVTVIYFYSTAASEIMIENDSRILGRADGNASPGASVFYLQYSVTTISITNSVISGATILFQLRRNTTFATINLGTGAVLDKSWAELNDSKTEPDYNITPQDQVAIMFQAGGQGMITLDGDAYIRGYGTTATTIGNKANFTFSETYEGKQIIRESNGSYYCYDDVDTAMTAAATGDIIFTYSKATADAAEAKGYTVAEENGYYKISAATN